MLFYNNDYLSLFNKFIIYIIGIDLLLSTFYFFNTSKSQSQVEILDISNDINLDSEDDCMSNDKDSDFEVETDDCDTELIQNDIEAELIQNDIEAELIQNDIEAELIQNDIEAERIQTVDNTEQTVDNTEQLHETLEKIGQIKVQDDLTETKSVDDIDSEQVIVVKKKRGRKPNHLKMQVS
jgi:hypothetical protein